MTERWEPLIRINAECPGYRSAIAAMSFYDGAEPEDIWLQHSATEDSITGIVFCVQDDWLDDGHRFTVTSDSAIDYGDGTPTARRFLRVAAGEIELLDRRGT